MTYKPKTKPMAHQRAALRAAARQPPGRVTDDVFAYLMDMGTGKSKVVLDEFAEMATSGGPQDLLVIAPAGSYRNWFQDKSDLQQSELNTHLGAEFRERLVDVGYSSGGGAPLKRRIEAMLRVTDRPRALFINVEAMSNVDRAIELAREFVSQRLAYFAVDESTKIKGWKSKRTRHIIEIGEEAAVRRILTGLITPKSPMDLFSQFQFLDWRILGYKSYFAFQARYAVTRQMESGGRKFKVIVGYQNIEELHEKIKPFSYRILKKDCLDLEEKVYTVREVEHTAEQKRNYAELKANATTMLGSGAHVSTQHAMTLFMRLHQINCGHVVDEEGNEHDVESNRIAALLEVLEEHSGKAVIWTPYTLPLRKIVAALTEAYGASAVAAYYGGNKGTRAEDERRFLGDPACRFMVATQGAGMMGNNWVCADLVVYFANDHNLEHRDQSEDRCHRKGQKNRVTYVDLIVPGTVDEKIVGALRKKMDIATMITGEDYRKWLI